MALTLVLANKAYSSWSLRPWLLLTQMKIPFEEIVIPMAQPDTRAKMLAFAPTGKCPALVDGKIRVWESLAIIEYIAETYPLKPIWPKGKAARALARSLTSEMHAGFGALRNHCPTIFRGAITPKALTPDVEKDVARIEEAWRTTRAIYGKNGAFLFGRFCAADAMFAPVVNRFYKYAIPVSADAKAYMAAMMALPGWKLWCEQAANEPWRMAYEDQA